MSMTRAWLCRRVPRPHWRVSTQTSLPSWSIPPAHRQRSAFQVGSCDNSDLVPLRKQLKDTHKATRTAKSSSSRQLEDDAPPGWELTVGIEIHAQLNTARKLFSCAPSENEGPPNESIAPFDIALPGSQPQFQIACVIPAIRAALALNCEVQQVSAFDRKHYFYHDQPAGYQITQYYAPLATNGFLIINADDGLAASDGEHITVGIKQLQLEQDTAKTQELEDGTNLIDFNRSGQALIEIISLPHIHSPEAAAAYVKKVQGLLYAVDAVTTGMEFGGLRADVNVSVRRMGDVIGGKSYGGVSGLGQRTEIKNLSSFKAVEEAVRAERNRQITILEAGGFVEGQTRGWSVSNPAETRLLRSKEGEVDYRYMPDPDLAPLRISKDVISRFKERMPLVPDEVINTLTEQYGLSRVDAKSLLALDDGERLNFFQSVSRECQKQGRVEDKSTQQRLNRLACNWTLHELGSLLTTSERPWSSMQIPARKLAQLVVLLDGAVIPNRSITGSSAKRVFKMLFEGDERELEDIITAEGLWFDAMSQAEYDALAAQVMDVHAGVVKDIQDKGRVGKLQFLVGHMMRTGDRNRIEASKAESVLRSKILG